MRADRLRTWLNKPADGATKLQLAHDGLAGLEPLSDWSRDDLTDDLDDVVGAIIEQAQDFADSREDYGKKYVGVALRWVGADGVGLKTQRHRIKPSPAAEGDDDDGSMDVSRPTDGLAVGALLKALLDKDRQLNEAYRTSLDANRSLMAQLMESNTKAYKIIEEMRSDRDTPPEVAAALEASPELREVYRQQSKAWERFTQLMPGITEMGIAAVANKLLPPVPAKTEAGPSNGVVAKAS